MAVMIGKFPSFVVPQVPTPTSGGTGGRTIYAMLGDVLFEVINSFETFKVKEPFDFPEHKVVEAKPKLQWTGNGLIALNLTLLFHARWCVPADRLDQLRKLAQAHRAYLLVFGDGTVLGYFVILEVDTTYEVQAANGELIEIGVEMKLLEYDGGDVSVTSGGGGGPPIGQENPIIFHLPPPPIGGPQGDNGQPILFPSGVVRNPVAAASTPTLTILRLVPGGILNS